MSTTIGRRIAAIVILVVFAVFSLGVWGLGIIGLGLAGEDKCIYAPPEAVGYDVEVAPFPPRFTCVYTTSDGGALEVDHPVYASVAVLWIIGFPIVAVSGLTLLAVGMVRSRSRSSSFWPGT